MTTEMTTVTCYRCHGFKNAFARFGHIAYGRCFLCAGNLTIEIPTWKFEQHKAANAKAIAESHRRFAERPYILAVDGMETVASIYATWEQARNAQAYGRETEHGTLRIAKWDGECHRYRDGSRVRFAHQMT
jgi:hypothetical protein